MNGISRLIIATASILGIFVVMLIYAANENERMDRLAANFAGREIEAGALLYYEACAQCHGQNGEGLVGPPLNTAELLVDAPGEVKPPRLLQLGYLGDLRSFLEGAITYGRVGTVMPPWGAAAGGPFRDDQVSALASFIMNWGVQPEMRWGGAELRTAIGGVESIPAVAQPLGAPPSRDIRSAALGRYLFEGPSGCATCHTFNGATGTVGPELTNVVANQGRDYVYQSIINPSLIGAEGHMPGIMPETFEFSLTDIEIQSIIDYLESPEAAGPPISEGIPPAPTEPLGPEHGQQLAQSAGCIACHTTDGSSPVGPTWRGLFGSTREFEDGSSAVADEAYLHESIVNPGAKIVRGFQNIMPAFYGDTLAEAEITDIIEYIKTLQ